MTRLKLALNSLSHYRWLNLAVLAGVAVTSAILSGALVVGDSVKESLRRNGAARISKTDFALVGGDRFFTTELANAVSGKLEATVAPVLQTVGTASTPDGSKRANNVQIVGVTPHFWGLALGKTEPLADGQLAINDALARRLEIGVGDPLIARVELPGVMSKDAPLSGESNKVESMRQNVDRVVGSDEFGRYLINAEQIPVPTIFMPIADVQQLLDKPDRANILLFGESAATFDEFRSTVAESWTLADASVTIDQIHGDFWRVGTDRVFIDPVVEKAVFDLYPNASGVLTYLVNTLRAGEGKETPYSMVAAAAGAKNNRVFPPDFADDEVVIIDWLAEDLGVEIGGEVSMDFFVVGNARKLEEKPATFKVRKITPLADETVNQDWTPVFPGVSGAADAKDWEPGMPIDLDRIRDNDETFWDDHKATPKAFISLAAGQKLWANRFGELTGIHIPAADLADAADFEAKLRGKLNVGDFGLISRDLRGESAAAVADSYDFGQLFASMSGFLIIAALILTALVFVFGIEQRRNQIGLLLALGVSKSHVRSVFLIEALFLAIIGASIGLAGGIVYTKLALAGLGGAWQDAAVGIEFVYAATAQSLGISWVGTVILALLVVWIATLAVSRIQPSQLISGSDSARIPKHLKTWFWAALATGVFGTLGGFAVLFVPVEGAAMAKQGKFFGAGFLLVFAGIGFAYAILTRMQLRDFGVSSIGSLGRTNAVRRKGRSLAVVTLMAAGVFMVTAINSLRLSGQTDAGQRSSGTGGFDYLGESTLPIYDDLNTDEGREQFGISARAGAPDDFRIVQMRVSQGDDASCLNLNRAQQPRVLGVDPAVLAERGSFFFMSHVEPMDDEVKSDSPWRLLNDNLGELPGVTNESDSIQVKFAPVIPGIIDAATATYALKKKLGDLIEYKAANGETFYIRLVGLIDNSVLQGGIVISEPNFLKFFPEPGYRFFLMDFVEGADPAVREEHAATVTRQLQDQGLELMPAWQRLNEFNAIQNTYLSIFSTLGGLGIFLGTIGLGVVVARNILERKGQMGLLEAVGFTKESLGKLVVSEHWFLHVFGVLLGVSAAMVSILPTLSERSTGLPVWVLVGLNGAILIGGLIFCWLAARSMLRTRLIDSLRHE